MSEAELEASTAQYLEFYKKIMEQAMSFEQGYPEDEFYRIHEQSKEIVMKRFNNTQSLFNEINQTVFVENSKKLKNLIENAFDVFQRQNDMKCGRQSSDNDSPNNREETVQCSLNNDSYPSPINNSPRNRPLSTFPNSEQTATTSSSFSNIESIGTVVAGAAALAATAFFGYKAYSNRNKDK